MSKTMASEQERLQKEIAELQAYEKERRQTSDMMRENKEHQRWWSETKTSYQLTDRYKEQLRREIAKAEQRVATIDKDLQAKYRITKDPRVQYDTIPSKLDQAIQTREEHLQTLDPQQQQVPSMAERRAAKLAAREQQGREQPPSQATQTPMPSQQASVHSSQSQQQTAVPQQPKQDLHQTFLRNQEGRTTVEDYGRQQQAQHEQEFYRQLDQHYEKQPPTQPPPAPQQPGHLKDLSSKDTGQSGQQTPYEQLYSREAAQHAGQLKQIEQGVQQLKTEMQALQQPGPVREFNIRETVREYEKIYAEDAQRWSQEHPQQEQQSPTHHDRPQDGHGSRYQEHYRQANPTNSDASGDHTHSR